MNLTSRLLEWMIGPLLLFWAISTGAAYLVASATADDAADHRLGRALNALAHEWIELRGDLTRNDFPAAPVRRWLLQTEGDLIRFVVLDEQANVLAGDEAFAGELHGFYAVSRRPVWIDFEKLANDESVDFIVDDRPYRIRSANVSTGGQRALMIVGQDKELEKPMFRRILYGELIPLSIILFLSVGLVVYGVAYVSRPMTELQTQLGKRGPDNLTQIETAGLPQELDPLMQGINALIQRLERGNEAQRRFISDAAHQLRTPIAALQNQCELLRSLPTGPQRDRTLASLQSTALRASRLATQLLSLARAESAESTSTLTLIDLKALCQSIVADVADVALAKDLELSFDQDDTGLTLPGDATLLGEMIRNLLDNAFKYTPPGGSVAVTVRGASRELVVEDSGPNIAPQDREAVFAPFARRAGIDRQIGHPIAGAGLGLTIIREVVRSHRGTIGISDSTLGGARFTVRFLR